MTVMMTVAVVMIMRMVIVAGCGFRRGMTIGLLVMVRFQGERKLCLRNRFRSIPDTKLFTDTLLIVECDG